MHKEYIDSLGLSTDFNGMLIVYDLPEVFTLGFVQQLANFLHLTWLESYIQNTTVLQLEVTQVVDEYLNFDYPLAMKSKHLTTLWEDVKDWIQGSYQGSSESKDISQVVSWAGLMAMHISYVWTFMSTMLENRDMVLDTIYNGIHMMAFDIGRQSSEILHKILMKVAHKSGCESKEWALCFDE